MLTQRYIRSAVIILGLLLLQTTFISAISLDGYLPDIFILFLVAVALRRGQMEATVTGFIVGLLQDIVTTRFFGLAALTKTVTGFIAGYFYNENTTEQTLGSYRYILLVGLCSLVHNFLYFTIFFQGTEGSVIASTLTASFGTMVYTCAVSLVSMFYFSYKYRTSWVE